MPIYVYISGKADHTSAELDRAATADEPEKLRLLSNKMAAGAEIWRGWCLAHAGEVLTFDRDEFSLRIPAEYLKDLPQLRDQYAGCVDSTVSIGVGTKLTEANRARQAAMKKGGDQIQLYGPPVEEALGDTQMAKSEYESAAFKYQDKIYPTGRCHDIGELPVEIQDVPLEEGYVKRDGTYVPKTPLNKADSPEPTEANSPAGGGGFMPPQTEQAPESPSASPEVPPDMHQAFGQLASAQGQKDTQEAQAQQQQEGQASQTNDLKKQVVTVLKVLKDRAQELEAIQQQDPQLYQALTGMVQSMIAMARTQFGSTPQAAEPVQKAESTVPQHVDNTQPWLKKDRPWLTATGRPSVIYAHPNPRSGDITALEWLNDGALHVHFKPKPWELLRSPNAAMTTIPAHDTKGQARYLAHTNLPTSELIADKKAVMGATANLDKAALEAGLTGRHKVNYPVGTQIDGSPSGTHEAGELKVQDPASGKTKWREVRSGLVMGADGQPASSRHPQD